MKRFVVILSALLLAACSAEDPLAEEKLVIDGWIDSGGFPVVMVSTTLPVGREAVPKDELKSHVASWARVSIIDGEEEYVLMGKRDDRYFPPYIYTTSRFRGEAGKTYELNVYYKGRSVSAQTTIPEPAALENIRAVKSSAGDSLYTVSAEIGGGTEAGRWYKVFTMVEGRDSCFRPSFIGNFEGSAFTGGKADIKILPPTAQKWSEFDSCFRSGDRVRIKFCTMDERTYGYWCDYEDILTISRNPLFPVSHGISSCIDGGLGLWAGYGAAFYTIEIP